MGLTAARRKAAILGTTPFPLSQHLKIPINDVFAATAPCNGPVTTLSSATGCVFQRQATADGGYLG